MGDGSVFAAPKTKHGRRLVPMRPVLRGLLEQHQRRATPNPHNLVFANQAGEPLDATNVINRVYLPGVKGAGLRRIRFHDLRHTFVTYCAGAGVPLAKVGDWVGHSDARITEIYRHASADSEAFGLGLLDTFDAAPRSHLIVTASSGA
jgi:integrase